MRLAFLTHNFPRHPGDVAGAFLLPLARALIGRGHDVRVVAPADAGRGGWDSVDGVPVLRVRYAAPARENLAYTGELAARVRTVAGFRAFLRLLHALRRGAEDELRNGARLVHAHWWVPAGMAAPAGAPTILTVHGTDAALLARWRVARRIARPVFARALAVTAVSRHLAALVSQATGRELPDEAVLPMPAVLPEAPVGTPRAGIVLVSRLVPQKRVGLAIEALAHLRGGGRHEHLTVVGDGPERGALEALASRHGVADAVRFVGAVPTDRVHAHFAAAEVAIFPARGEGFGLVAAEALAAGTPLVACHDGGGVLDVMATPGAGRLADPEPPALAAALADLLADPDRRAAALAAGATWRHRLQPDRVAEAYEQLYLRVAGG